MKNLKKVLAMVLVVAMVASFAVTASAKTFTDAESINYTTAVEVLSGLGVIDGKTDGAFHPTDDVTRGQFAKMAAYVLNGGVDAASSYATSATTAFSDVASGRYYTAGIGYVASKGIVDGFTDGTFRPDNSVTGIQAAKILLGALGYDSAIEGYTGSAWKQNVLNDGEEAGLFTGMDSVNLAANLTREEAAQMIWNALQATMVRYATAGTSITTSDGTTITTGGSAATAVSGGAGFASTTAKASTQELVEKCFPKLTVNSSSTDAYGRPATDYTLGTDVIATEVATPVATYSGTFTGNAWTTLLKTYTSTADDPEIVTYNGGHDDNVAKPSDLYISATTGVKGYEVEVYATGKEITDIVVVEGYLAKVGTVTAATKKNPNASVTLTVYEAGYVDTNTKGKTFTLTDDLDSTTDLYDVITGSYKTGDYIVAYCKPGWDVATADKAFIEFAATTSVNGTITKATKGTYACLSSIVIDGTTYPVVNEYVQVKADGTYGRGVANLPKAGDKGTLYLVNGNVLGYVADTVATSNTAVVITKKYSTLEDGVIVNKVDGIVASGETKTFNLSGDVDVNGIYEYTTDPKTGLTTFAEITNTTTLDGSKTVKLASTTIATDTLKLSALENDFYFATDMKVIYKDGTVVTGKPVITEACVAYAVISKTGDTKTITTLFVNAEQETISTSDAIIFVAAKGDTSSVLIGTDETEVTAYTAYIAGEEVEDVTALAKETVTAGFYKEVKDSTTGLYKLEDNGYSVSSGTVAVINGKVSAYASGIVTVSTKDIDVSKATIVDLTEDGDGIAATDTDVYVIYNETTKVASYVYVVDHVDAE